MSSLEIDEHCINYISGGQEMRNILIGYKIATELQKNYDDITDMEYRNQKFFDQYTGFKYYNYLEDERYRNYYRYMYGEPFIEIFNTSHSKKEYSMYMESRNDPVFFTIREEVDKYIKICLDLLNKITNCTYFIIDLIEKIWKLPSKWSVDTVKFLRNNKTIIKTLSSLSATDVYIANKNTAYKILMNARENATYLSISTEDPREEFDFGNKRRRRKVSKRSHRKRQSRKRSKRK